MSIYPLVLLCGESESLVSKTYYSEGLQRLIEAIVYINSV